MPNPVIKTYIIHQPPHYGRYYLVKFGRYHTLTVDDGLQAPLSWDSYYNTRLTNYNDVKHYLAAWNTADRLANLELMQAILVMILVGNTPYAARCVETDIPHIFSVPEEMIQEIREEFSKAV